MVFSQERKFTLNLWKCKKFFKKRLKMGAWIRKRDGTLAQDSAWTALGLSVSGFRTWGGKRERRGRQSRADWRPGGALAQFRLMSGQLEVHHGALCTAPVSPNLCCRGPYPQPGHSTREALTLWPILLWQLHSSRSNAKRYRMYTRWPCSLVSVNSKDTGVQKPGRATGEKPHSGRDGGRLQREKIDL